VATGARGNNDVALTSYDYSLISYCRERLTSCYIYTESVKHNRVQEIISTRHLVNCYRLSESPDTLLAAMLGKEILNSNTKVKGKISRCRMKIMTMSVAYICDRQSASVETCGGLEAFAARTVRDSDQAYQYAWYYLGACTSTQLKISHAIRDSSVRDVQVLQIRQHCEDSMSMQGNG